MSTLGENIALEADTEIEISYPEVGMAITSPRLNNQFTLGVEFSHGSFSVVRECTDLWGNDLVAKVLKPNNQPFETVQAKAVLEADALEALRHPNIVYIHDAFEFGNLFYIIVERCSQDITDLIAQPEFDGYYWIKPVARCLLQALNFTHSNGIAHCDIHPGNVLFQFPRNEATQQSGTSLVFKLSDLGIARLTNDVEAVGTFLTSIRPPECIDSQEFGAPNHQVDIYQAGLLLLQLLRGELRQYSEEERLNGQPRMDALLLPEPYSTAIEKALRRHVIHRTSSALEFWQDLQLG